MENTLTKLGLSQDEIRIYFYLLRKTKGKVTEISKELSIARTSVYRYLEILQNKSFVSNNIENGVQIFYPIEPKKILNILQSIKGEFEEILPDLEKIKNPRDDKTKVQIFKGLSGVRNVMMDIISEKKDYYGIGDGEIYTKELKIFGLQWVRQIDELKIKGKIMGTKNLLNEVAIAKNEVVKILPEELVPEIAIYVYGNKTAKFIWSNIPYVILIENEEIANSQRKYFNYLWENVAK